MSHIASLLHATVPPVKEGRLHKTASAKGSDEFRGGPWAERWCRLHADGRLEYSKRQMDSEAAGSVDLRAARVDPLEPAAVGGRAHAIRIAAAKQVFVYLAAASAGERDQWLAALRRAAGVEEDDMDTLASVAALDVKGHTANLCAWAVLLQHQQIDAAGPPIGSAAAAAAAAPTGTTPGSEAAPPELAMLVLGAEGSIRIYRECKLWRSYPSGSLLSVASSCKAEYGIGIGKHWKMLVEIRMELRESSTGAAGAGGPGGAVRVSAFVSTEDEAAVLVPLLRGSQHGDVAEIARHCSRQPALLGPVEVYDTSFRTQWAAKFACLSPLAVLLFRNGNDPSPWRVFFLGAAFDPKKEGALGMQLPSPLEREPLTIKFASEVERDAWADSIAALLAGARTRREKRLREEAARLAEEERAAKAKPRFQPLQSLDSPTSASAPKPASRLSAADLAGADEPPPPPPPADAPSFFSFPHPALEPLAESEAAYVVALGSGAAGQLGQRNKLDALRPVLVESLRSKAVRCVGAGSTHAAAVTSAGHVYSFGSGGPGVLGLGERMLESKAPYLLTSLLTTPVRSVACGARHTLALSVAGAVWAWGENHEGQCGVGHTNPVVYPAQLAAFASLPVASLAAGGAHSAAVSGALELYTWGRGTHGCLGLGSTDSQATPVRNAGLLKAGRVAAVAAGHDFTLAVLDSGAVYSCGNNAEGQLGHGDRAKRSLFAEIRSLRTAGVKVFEACAGQAHSAVLGVTASDASETAVYTFGAGVANGFREAQLTPVHVAALTNVRSLSATHAHTLAVSAASRAFAFGLNRCGELGNGQAGVQALVKVRLNPSIMVAGAAAGNAFSLLLCRGQPPEYLLPGAPPEQPPPPPPSEASSISHALGMGGGGSGGDSGVDGAGNADLAAAMSSITRLLQMEASLSDAASGSLARTLVQPGHIDLLQMRSIGNLEGPRPVAALPAPPLPTPPLPTPPLPKPPAATSFSSASAAPARASPPPAAPFVFTAAAVAHAPVKPVASAAPSAPPVGVMARVQQMQQAGTAPFVFAPPPPSASASGSAATAAGAAAAPLYNVPVAAPAPLAAPAPAAVVAAPKKEKLPLPGGWKKVKDEASGRSYYFHVATKATSWRRPKPEEPAEADAPPPPPPPPAADEPLPPPPPSADDSLPPPPPAPADDIAPPPPSAPADDDDVPPPPPPPQ